MTTERRPFKAPQDLDLNSALSADYRPQSRFMSLNEIMALPKADWLVKGLIPLDGLGVIYGKPGAGKTFLALAMALSIGHGMPCFGRRAVQGGVAFVAGEGARGLQNRLRAWHAFHDRDWRNFGAVQVLPHPIDLLDAGKVERLVLDIAHRFQGEPPKMVVFDTLARCFGDGDENRQADMSRLVEAGELVRRAFKCAVVIIHHTPKESDELRGSSVLEGASDFVLRVSKTESGMETHVRKLKDGKDGVVLGFRMESQNLGTDEDGDTILTPVAVLEGEVRECAAPPADAAPAGKNQSAVLAVLAAAGEAGLTGDEWRDAAKASGAVGGANPARAFREARAALERDKLVLAEGDRFLAA
ncbi:AAA family ATPase [Paramagnetospirillum marisnigri]|uniref:AAA family ATPase n=1 Tax=Paramagnetospirillum marisnigri TaxID=1285242 RepID=UPI00083899A4|nr:AAA family ATPase [Paramagnetospirillum marisnigri]